MIELDYGIIGSQQTNKVTTRSAQRSQDKVYMCFYTYIWVSNPSNIQKKIYFF